MEEYLLICWKIWSSD